MEVAEKRMQVKIINCDAPTSWYAQRVGEQFSVYEHIDPEYYVLVEDQKEYENNNLIARRIISKTDTEILST